MKKSLGLLVLTLLLVFSQATLAASPFLEKGYQYLADGDWKRAADQFKEGLASGGYDLDLANGLVEAYLNSPTKLADLVKEYENIAKEDYLNPVNHYVLGRLRLAYADEDYYRDYTPAVESFSIAIAFGLDGSYTRYFLAEAYKGDNTWGNYRNPRTRSIDNYTNAVENYLCALEMDPLFWEPYQALSIIYLVTNQKERSLRIIQDALAVMPDNGNVIYWYALFSYLTENYEDAVSYGLHVSQMYPKSASVYGLLGLAYEKLGEKYIAIAMLRQGFNLGLEKEWSYYDLKYEQTLDRLLR